MKRILGTLITFTLFAFAAGASALEIGLDQATVAVGGSDTIVLHHVTVEGLSGTFSATLRWDPERLVFAPVSAEQETGYTVITAEELRSILASQDPSEYVLMDVRTPEEFARGHIQGAVNYPTDKSLRDFPDEVKERIQADVPDHSMRVIAYCGGLGCGRSGWAADSLVAMGYTNVFRFQAGYIGWCEAGYHFTVNATQVMELTEAIAGGDGNITLIDVREPSEFASGHIPGAINVPLSAIRDASSAQDLDDIADLADGDCNWKRPLVVYCQGEGDRYLEAANKLTELGFVRIVEFPGGVREWTSEGGELVQD